MIYALSSPTDGVRYVGRTRCPWHRMSGHFYKKLPLSAWVRSASAVMVELETCDYLQGKERERYWIEHYRQLGCDMFNVWPVERAA